MLFREEADALEADLQRYYGVDLADYWRGKLSLRRISVLVQGLPAESLLATKAAEDSAGWSLQAYLLADIFHAVTGEEHPARPSAEKREKKARAHRLRDALQAQKERRRTK